MNVFVVGGGFSGISASVRLAEAGASVTLIESRQRLGGRTYSMNDPVEGSVVDNGQHVLMRCCNEALALLETLGTRHKVAFQDRLDLEFRDVNGAHRLRVPRGWPGPLSLIGALFRFNAIRWHHALSVFRVVGDLHSLPSPTLTVAEWLDQRRQPDPLVRRFWTPLCISILNLRPERASARLLASVLKKAFSGSAQGGDLGWPTAGLSQLHDPTHRYLAERGGSVRLRTLVREVEPGPFVTLRDDERVAADAVVVATPPPVTRRLLASEVFRPLSERLARFMPSPIVSLNLWLDDPLVERELLGLDGEPFDWVFRRDLLHGEAHPRRFHLNLIASAAETVVDCSDENTVDLGLASLARAGFDVPRRVVRRATVIRERRATFSEPPTEGGIPQRTVDDRIVLAGDWTDTGFPCTIEGAVRSGRLAADLLLGLPDAEF